MGHIQHHQHIYQLEQKPEFNPQDYITMIWLADNNLTKCLVQADNKCCNQCLPMVSPSSSYILGYWAFSFSSQCTNRPYTQALKVFSDQLPQHHNYNPTSSQHLTPKTRQSLKTIHWEATNKCKEFQNSLITAAKHTKDNNQCKLILGFKDAKETRTCFQAVKYLLKPITWGPTCPLTISLNQPLWKKAQDVTTMEAHLIEQGWVHFSQAHGTPFTIPPLSELLQYDGVKPFGESIFHGDPISDNIPITPATRLLWQHQPANSYLEFFRKGHWYLRTSCKG